MTRSEHSAGQNQAATPQTTLRLLVSRAAERYRSCGRFTYHFARGKLSTDPVFATLLSQPLLPRDARLLDLGCGQGLVAAWLIAARECHLEGHWPPSWPAPPHLAWVLGVEIDSNEVRRAQQALGQLARIECADLSAIPFPEANVILILDVLHYLDPASQRAVIQRARARLTSPGVLLLRVGDAAGGLRFVWSRWVDAAAWRLRGRGRAALHFRTLTDWVSLISSCGFSVKPIRMTGSRSFANVVLIATPALDSPATLSDFNLGL